ncbi:MAG: PEGA domain-containing protein [Patescibacteria group bacterium]
MKWSLVALLVVLSLVWLFGCTDDPTAPEQKYGRLIIESQPDSARLFLNWQDKNLFTPDTLRLAVGSYTVKLTKTDYQDYTCQKEVKENQTAVVKAKLKSTLCQLALLTNPVGAQIIIGFETVGTTPDTLTFREDHLNNLILRKEGYSDWKLNYLKLYPDSLLTLNIDLTYVIGSIAVSSIPTGAKVILDSYQATGVTPCTFSGVFAGSHSLSLRLKYYSQWDSTVTVTPSLTTAVNVSLNRAHGTLAVNSSPVGAEIVISGADQGCVTPHTFSGFDCGRYEVKLLKENYAAWQDSVEVKENSSTYVTATLTANPAYLTVNSSPFGAEIFLNNEPTGQVTPYTFSGIFPRLYDVKLKKEGYLPFIQNDVDIGLGQHVTLDILLIPAPNRELYLTSSDTLWVLSVNDPEMRPLVAETNPRLVVSPNGEWLVTVGADNMRIYRKDGTLYDQLPRGADNRSTDVSWATDSQSFLFGSYNDGLYRYDAAGKTLNRIFGTWCFCYDHNPVYMAGNDRLVFVHHQWGGEMTPSITTIRGGYGQIASLIFTAYDQYPNLTWLADSSLALQAGWNLYVSVPDLTGTSPADPTLVIEGMVSSFAISPDKTRYAFNYGYDLYFGQVGVWSHTKIADISGLSVYVWTPSSDALVARGSDGLHWVTLQGQDYLFLEKSLASGDLDIKP